MVFGREFQTSLPRRKSQKGADIHADYQGSSSVGSARTHFNRAGRRRRLSKYLFVWFFVDSVRYASDRTCSALRTNMLQTCLLSFLSPFSRLIWLIVECLWASEVPTNCCTTDCRLRRACNLYCSNSVWLWSVQHYSENKYILYSYHGGPSDQKWHKYAAYRTSPSFCAGTPLGRRNPCKGRRRQRPNWPSPHDNTQWKYETKATLHGPPASCKP